MLILSEADTRELVDIDAVLAIIEDEARAQAAGRVVYPDPPTQVLLMNEPHCRYRIKSCALPDVPIAGVRIIGYPLGKGGNHSSTRFVLLSNPATGEAVALVDDHWTYTLRTAASAVVGLSHLTPERPLSVCMVGAGNLAGAMLLLLNHIGRLGEVKVVSRRPESRQAFAKEWAAKLDRPIDAADSIDDALQGCELIVTATSANAQILKAGQMLPGVTICTLGRFELAPELYAEADKLVVDRWSIAKASPDVKELVAGGTLADASVHAELHELVTGAKPGREKDAETIIFRTDGLVSQDVAIAYAVYKSAQDLGVGITLPSGSA